MSWRHERDAALVQLEHDRPGPSRAEAAEVLCALACEVSAAERVEFAPAVVQLLADRQEDVRCAGLALASFVLPPQEAREVLVRHVTGQPPRVRVEAVGRLADLALPDARGALAAMLEDESPPVRFEAARGLAGLRHSAGLEVLVEALHDPDLRFRAAAALAQLGDPHAVPALQKVFKGWLLPAFDRTQVAGALARLGAAEGVEHLYKRAARSWSVDRAMAIELLGEVKASGALARLLALLGDVRDSCRGAAARGLGRLGDPLAAEGLLEVLDERGTPDDVKLDAAEGLLRLAVPEGRARVSALHLDDDEARAELAAMLSESS